MSQKHLIVQRLTYQIQHEDLIRDFTHTFTTEDRISIVGINGAGKSTLLKLLAGKLTPHEGTISYQGDISVGYLEQIHEHLEHTVWEELEKSHPELAHIKSQMDIYEERFATGETTNEDMTIYSSLQERFMDLGGYTLQGDIHQVLQGLHIPKKLWDAPLTQLSGGERTKINLAKMLLVAPDMLLLDEPTNFLDLASVEWLEWFLNNKWKKGFIIVSHDRYFLDHVTKDTMELSPGNTPEYYPGSYTFYVTEREQRMKRKTKMWNLQQEEVARQEEIVRRLKGGSRSGMAKSREKMLDKLERVDAPEEHVAPVITFKKAEVSADIILNIKDVFVGYSEDNPLFFIPHLMVKRGEKIAIMGPNGAGKSTLIKTITHELPLLSGYLSQGKNIRLGYYAQTLAHLNEERSILEELFGQGEQFTRDEVRKFMGRFLFSGEEIHKKIGSLSGGERARVALAKLSMTPTNVLILDEPTNHLDYLAREALEKGILDYKGTILFISHDRYFIDKIASHLWMVDPDAGELKLHYGNYSQYQEKLNRGTFSFDSYEQEEAEVLVAQIEKAGGEREWKKRKRK